MSIMKDKKSPLYSPRFCKDAVDLCRLGYDAINEINEKMRQQVKQKRPVYKKYDMNIIRDMESATEIELLEYQLKLADERCNDLLRLLYAIPECTLHGNTCIPHALEWIKEQINYESLRNI